MTLYVLESDRMPFKGRDDTEKDAATCTGEIAFTHGEPADLQQLVCALCTIDMSKRLGCTSGVSELKAHEYFKGFNWEQLEGGGMEAPYRPSANDSSTMEDRMTAAQLAAPLALLLLSSLVLPSCRPSFGFHSSHSLVPYPSSTPLTPSPSPRAFGSQRAF